MTFVPFKVNQNVAAIVGILSLVFSKAIELPEVARIRILLDARWHNFSTQKKFTISEFV